MVCQQPYLTKKVVNNQISPVGTYCPQMCLVLKKSLKIRQMMFSPNSPTYHATIPMQITENFDSGVEKELS